MIEIQAKRVTGIQAKRVAEIQAKRGEQLRKLTHSAQLGLMQTLVGWGGGATYSNLHTARPYAGP